MRKMLGLLFLFFGFVQSQNGCEDGWLEYNGTCYKHFDTPNALDDFSATMLKCRTIGAELATGAKQGERDFIFNKINNGYQGHIVAGVIWISNGSWVSVDPTETIDWSQWVWCRNGQAVEPNFLGSERCTHYHNPPHYCMCNYHCNSLWRRYVCRKPKPLVCKNENTVAKDGKCVCKEGYVDIRETDDLDKKKYKEAEKCVPENPCNSLRRSFSLIFIVDASQSIQERNWPSLVDFVKSASTLVPNQVNVGFIKFSSNVSFADWLPARWSRREFEQMVPEDFDAGYTNTPAAIEKAIEMFDEDGRRADKVAVLITDGLPVVDEQTDKQKALADTRTAISKLQRKGVDAVALGFGPELREQRGDAYIKKWLSDPEEDYFSFDRMACDLRKVHMQMLLQKVCRRYV